MFLQIIRYMNGGMCEVGPIPAPTEKRVTKSARIAGQDRSRWRVRTEGRRPLVSWVAAIPSTKRHVAGTFTLGQRAGVRIVGRSMKQDLIIVLTGAFGASCEELIHWYNLRTKLASARYKKLRDSLGYWLMTGIMILSSGVGAWVWYHGDKQLHVTRDYLLVGAAFPLILKKAVAALTAEQERKLGPTTEVTPLRSYFDIN
jgi:hypothetical protein